MKRTLVLLILLLSVCAWAREPAGVLPKVFGGWLLQKSDISREATKADPVYANLLKEYGFAVVEAAQYVKADRTMTVRLARFNDASGAYGAYTFYRSPDMAPEEIGDRGASKNQRVLFYRGNLLVDVKLDRVTPMSGGELRELARDLPTPTGGPANLPSVINYLPHQGLVENTTKYVAGPVALSYIQSPIPAEVVDFSTGAEIVSADYRTGNGTAKLMLISYPTPGVAGVRLHAIESYRPEVDNGGDPAIYSKRTGPLVGVISGTISPSEARTLLASVNYDADITWNENTYFDKKENLGYLMVNVVLLISIIFGLALVAGVAFGGIRILLKKLFPDRYFDRPEDVEIIRLNIGK